MDLHGAILIWEVFHLFYEIYEIQHICYLNHYESNADNEYLSWLSEHYAKPTVRAEDEDEGADFQSMFHLAVPTISTLVHAYEAYEYWEDQYYWMLLGIDLGKTLAHSLVLGQEYGLYHFVDESPQFVRFYRDHDEDH